eukprot:5647496-Lingulodinium_polyedra.AAC.1
MLRGANAALTGRWRGAGAMPRACLRAAGTALTGRWRRAGIMFSTRRRVQTTRDARARERETA